MANKTDLETLNRLRFRALMNFSSHLVDIVGADMEPASKAQLFELWNQFITAVKEMNLDLDPEEGESGNRILIP